MSPSPMLCTEQGQELQQGKDMRRLKEHQEDRRAECPRAFAVAVSSSAPAVPCYPVPPHRGRLQGPRWCQALAL